MTAAQLKELLDPLISVLLDYALLLVSIGTVVMALIELGKSVWRARMRFHRVLVENWLNDEAPTGVWVAVGRLGKGAQAKVQKRSLVKTGNPTEARKQLLLLAVGGEKNEEAFYDQPTEKMMGQIQAAANVALDFPDRYTALYEFLTTESPEDAALWAGFQPRTLRPRPTHGADIRTFEEESRPANAARARLGNLVTRRLDALQIVLVYAWERLNQTVAVVGGGMLTAYLLTLSEAGKPLAWPLFIGLSLMGGMLAPFAKDVVKALSPLRVSK